MILAGDGADEAILVWPLPAPPGSSAEQVASTVAKTLGGQDRTFQIWIQPSSSNDAGLMFCRENGRLRGVLRLQLLPHGQALATGYQAASDCLEARRQDLEQVLTSFRALPALPREPFVEPRESAFSVMVPGGWYVQGSVDRSRNPSGGGALVWVVEDPHSRARVAQESLVIDMVGGSVMGVLGGLAGMFGHALAGSRPAPAPPGLQFGGLPMQVFLGQHGWKSQPFMNVQDYCQKVLLPMALPLRPDLTLEGVMHDPALDELAHQSLQPVEMQMGAPVSGRPDWPW